jgi:hypothetical protein
MSEEWTELDEAIEEVRAVRRAISARFDHDPYKYYEYLVEYQKQFAHRFPKWAEQEQQTGQADDSGKSAA